MKLGKLLSFIIISSFLAACGGGGGSGSGDAGGGSDGEEAKQNTPKETSTNVKPVANAGKDITAIAGETILLDGTDSSDSDGEIVSYTWEQISGAKNIDVVSRGDGKAEFIVDKFYIGEEEYVFQLKVVDDKNGTDIDSVTVNFLAVEVAPEANAGEDSVVFFDRKIYLTASASKDLNEDIVSYSWSQLDGPEVSIEDQDQEVAYFIAPDYESEIKLELSITDANGNKSIDSVSYSVENPFHLDFPPVERSIFSGDNLSLKGRIHPALIDNSTLRVAIGDDEVLAFRAGLDSWKATVPFLWREYGNQLLRFELSTTTNDTAESFVIEKRIDHRPILHDFRLAHYYGDKVFALSNSVNKGISLFEVDLFSKEIVVVLNDEDFVGQVDTISYDKKTNGLLFIDVSENSIKRIDLSSKKISVISGGAVGEGISFEGLYRSSIQVSPTSEFIHVFDYSLQALIEVDVLSGFRRVISQSGSVGGGVDFENSRLSVTDFESGFAYIYDDRGPDKILQVELETGNRSVISSNMVGSGPLVDLASSIWLDGTNGKLVIAGKILGEEGDFIVEVDVETGNRTALSMSSNDQELVNPVDLFKIGGGRNYIVSDSSGYDSLDAIFSVDSITGERNQLFRDELGLGEIPRGLTGVTLDQGSNVAYMADSVLGKIYVADLESGDRYTIFDNEPSSESHSNSLTKLAYDEVEDQLLIWSFSDEKIKKLDISSLSIEDFLTSENASVISDISSMQVDSANRTLYFSRYNDGNIYKIDLESKEASVVSGQGVGQGIAMSTIVAISFDSIRNKIIVSDDPLGIEAALLEVDIESGDRSVIFDEEDIYTSYRGWFKYLSKVSENGIIFAANNSGVYRLNIKERDWKMVSSNSMGDGSGYFSIDGIELDEKKDILYLVNGRNKTLMAVDPDSGDRVAISR
ncbi:PKD domain-containing protein [Microbulbifer sp. PSTR4-B]|uniref:PKD domain-containing protein n=1 Tax=Microbulbifer sp. PSTR4-B TaxID=3243396 RepID=UPI0040390DA4